MVNKHAILKLNYILIVATVTIIFCFHNRSLTWPDLCLSLLAYISLEHVGRAVQE